MMDLTGKTAVITGAAGGIGLAMAERFAGRGMKVVLSDIDEAALGAQVARLGGAGHDVAGIVTDVSSQDSVHELARFAVSTYGSVHVVCNNAGIGGGAADDKPLWEASLTDWRWVLDINLWGVIHGIRSFVPLLLSQGHESHIVNTASRAGLISGTSLYATSKHAVIAITEALYAQLRLAGAPVHVSLLCPGAVNTNLGKNSARIRPQAADSAGPISAHGTGFMEDYRKTVQTRMAGGSSPAEMADLLLDGMAKGDFYILPGTVSGGPIEARFRNLQERKILNPQEAFPQFAWQSSNG